MLRIPEPAGAGRGPRRPRQSYTMAPQAALAAVLTLVLSTGSASAGTSSCSNVTLVSTQLDALLAAYDRAWPPAAPAALDLALAVRHASIREADATVRLLADFSMSWTDKRLVWNASEWGCALVPVSAERLWLPDVHVLNAAASAAAAEELALRAQLASDGRVSWTSRLDLSAPVQLDLTDWPADEHEVVFKFGSLTHSVEDIELSINAFDPTDSSVFEAGAWELVSVNASESTWRRMDRFEMRVATWAVRLRRRAAAHAVAAAGVLAAVALLLLAAALLPPASRTPVCAAASFVAALWLVSASARVSGGSATGAPRSLRLAGALCACGGAAAAAAALALRVSRLALPPPHALRTLLNHAALLRHLTPLEVQGSEESSAWAAAAQLLDALCVLALLLALLLALALCL